MTNNDSRIDSLFDRFGKQPSAEKESRWLAMGGKVPYQAVELAAPGTNSPTVRVYFSNGDVAAIRYSTVAAVLYDAGEDDLSLLTRSGAFVLKGQHVLSLIEEFEKERVKVVRFYDENRHEAPANEGVIIHRIEWMAAKPTGS
jgi:hypothetical protein